MTRELVTLAVRSMKGLRLLIRKQLIQSLPLKHVLLDSPFLYSLIRYRHLSARTQKYERNFHLY